MEPIYYLTESDLVAIFAEWQRQWQADLDAFLSADEAFAEAPDEYGPGASRTFLRIKSELGR